MIDQNLILKIERLGDDVKKLRTEIIQRYGKKQAQVVSEELRREAASLAETWLVEMAFHEGLRICLDPDVLANLNIEFQRVLTYSDHATIREKYDRVLQAILKEYRSAVIIPLKQHFNKATPLQSSPAAIASPKALYLARSAFVGHSFAPLDQATVEKVVRCLGALGIDVQTGEKPKADLVSAKVRERIESCEIFVGLFTKKDKLSRKQEWTTSPWVIDEKAYALAKGKKLVLIKEKGVASIGGIQGDYEYLEFSRDDLADLVLRLFGIFQSVSS